MLIAREETVNYIRKSMKIPLKHKTSSFDKHFSCHINSSLLFRIMIVLLVFFWHSPAFGYLLQDEERGTSLSIFGIGGIMRLNYAWVDGNDALYEDSDDGFREGFDHREFLSLSASGMLFRDYTLEGEVHYNQDDDPDWNFFVKLARDESYLIFGDQPNMFEEPYFTRYTQPFRGLTLHVESDHVGITSFGAFTRGASTREELTPDGTSGPYNLSKIPVVPGSDIVTIEIRNQNDPSEVLEIRPQNRNVDYTIDYDSGEITFAQPVDPETFRGDKVVIVVIYRSEEESSAFRTAIVGSRITVAPSDWGTVGVTYISEFDRDPSLSDGFDARQEIYGIDAALKIGDLWRLTTEYALSQQQAANSDTPDPAQSFLAKLDGKVGDQVNIHGKYRLVERDFLTFANPDIDTNEQELDLAGTYAYRPEHSLKIGYSFLQDNLPQESEEPTTTTHRPYIEWEARVREQTQLFSKYEFIQKTDDQNPAVTDEQTHSLLVGGIQDFSTVPILKKLTLRGEYQVNDFEDNTNQEADTLTHVFGLRATTEPAREIITYFEQRERLIHDKDLKENTERQDISEIGMELNRWQRFSAQTKYQYRSVHDLLQDERESERHTVIFSAKYQPFDVLTTSGKVELRDETMFTSEAAEREESSSRSLNTEARLTYTPKKDLSLRLKYEYDYEEDALDVTNKTREDETEFRINYAFDKRKTRLTGIVKIERDLLEAPPTPKTKTRTTTYLASAARQLTDRWDILAQYKREMVELSADNSRDDILAEVGYKLGRFITFAGGYQYSRFQDNDEPDNEYTANSVYIKLIGKL